MDIAAGIAFAVMAVLLLEVPRRLFVRAAETDVALRYDAWLGFGLFAIGFAAYRGGIGGYLAEQFVYALAFQLLAAALYAAVRFGVTPNLYAGLLLTIALGHAYNTGNWLGAGLGLLVGGGLAAAALFGARRLGEPGGVGAGGVKLAVAVGALLGPSWGGGAVAAAGAAAALAAVGLTFAKRYKPLSTARHWQAPFDAALPLATALALWWSSL